MRILFMDTSPIWLNTLPYGFHDLGHEVIASGPLTKRNIIKKIDTYSPDLIVVIGWGPEQTAKKQCWIGKAAQCAGIPHIYWATEDPHFTHVFTLPLIRRLEPVYVFTISRKMVDFYRQHDIKAAHLDFGYHPVMHRRVAPLEAYRCQIGVLANAYPDVLSNWPSHYRYQSLQTLIKPLINRNIRIDFWGRNWQAMQPFLGLEIPSMWLHGFLTYPEAYKVYSSADIMLGLQNYEEQLTQRSYEILGSGGFLITSDTPGVRQLYQPKRDLVVSSGPEETVFLINHYLQHPEEREKIRSQGKASTAKHSYQQRAGQMIEVLKKEGILK